MIHQIPKIKILQRPGPVSASKVKKVLEICKKYDGV
jgi:hypothetical protein